MDFLFLLKKIIAALVLPPGSFLIAIVIALILGQRWPRTSLTAIWLATLSLLALSLPITADALIAALNTPRLDQRALHDAKAIVILGGGLRRATPEYGDTLSSHTLERVRYGAKLARETNLPILVTGGVVYGGKPEADVMAQTLSQEFHLAPRWIENRSRDTKQNFLNSSVLLRADGIDRVLLVTTDVHMRRSLENCIVVGFVCWSAPVSSHPHATDSWIEQLPSAGALRDSTFAIHEILGNVFFKYL